MGGKLTKHQDVSFHVTERHYVDGMQKIENRDLESMYKTLIMRLNYQRRKNTRDRTPVVVDTTLFSNSVVLSPGEPVIIPNTIDFLSGYVVKNPHETKSCSVYVRCGETVIERLDILPGTTHEIYTNRLYLLVVPPREDTRWNLYVEDHVGVEVSCKCGILHNSIINLYTGCIKDYVSMSGNRIEYSVFL